jgi:hypothetical protein
MFYPLCNFGIKYFKIQFIGIFYKAIQHKMEFGQAPSQDLLKKILYKFIWHFSDLYFIFYAF